MDCTVQLVLLKGPLYMFWGQVIEGLYTILRNLELNFSQCKPLTSPK